MITPGLAKSLKISILTSLGPFLSSLRASGKGMVEMRAWRKEGVESKREERWVLELLRKVVRSV